MKPIYSKIALLVVGLGVAFTPPLYGSSAPRRKKTKTTKSSSKTSSSSKKGKGSSSRKSSRSRRGSRARVYMPTAEQLEQMRLDSIRLRTGGAEPIRQASQQTTQQMELLATRFRQADSTLTRSEIKELYFATDERADTESFLNKIEREADELINQKKLSEALQVVQQGLWRTPTHIGLIKRACDLSLHLKSNRFDSYMYQLVELLSMLAHTGGNTLTREKAVSVRSASDALLFEIHWNETPREDILTTREEKVDGKTYSIITIRTGKGSEDHYYLLRSTSASATPRTTAR